MFVFYTMPAFSYNATMEIKIKRFDTSLPLPEYKTVGAAAFDLCARIEMLIKPRQIEYVPLNVAIEVPQGYFTKLVARSSTHKLGIMAANGFGVIDSDYCGDDNEFMFAAYNFTEDPVRIERGHRIAQAIVMPVQQVSFVEVESLQNESRGKFGSTGKM